MPETISKKYFLTYIKYGPCLLTTVEGKSSPQTVEAEAGERPDQKNTHTHTHTKPLFRGFRK